MTYDRQPENITEGITRNEKAKIREAVDLAKSLGIDLVPKTNSSSGHDGWLIPYAFAIPSSDSYSDIYMEQLLDAYDEIIEVFRPAYFHVGLDEDVFPDLDGRPLRTTPVHKQVLLADYEFLRRRGITMEIWCDGRYAARQGVGGRSARRDRAPVVLRRKRLLRGQDLHRHGLPHPLLAVVVLAR